MIFNLPIKKMEDRKKRIVPDDLDLLDIMKKMIAEHDPENTCQCDGCWDAFLYMLFTGEIAKENKISIWKE